MCCERCIRVREKRARKGCVTKGVQSKRSDRWFTQIIFNPGAFIDVIECACTDTFQSGMSKCRRLSSRFNAHNNLSIPSMR